MSIEPLELKSSPLSADPATRYCADLDGGGETGFLLRVNHGPLGATVALSTQQTVPLIALLREGRHGDQMKVFCDGSGNTTLSARVSPNQGVELHFKEQTTSTELELDEAVCSTYRSILADWLTRVLSTAEADNE